MRFLLWTALFIVFVASVGVLAVVGLYAYYAKDLPDYTQLDRRRVFQTARILDRNGVAVGRVQRSAGRQAHRGAALEDPRWPPARNHRR